MPVVVIPACFIDRANATPDDAECRVVGRTVSGVTEELFERFPALLGRFKDADGLPRKNWFNLFREQDGEILEDAPGFLLGEDERILLVNAIGC